MYVLIYAIIRTGLSYIQFQIGMRCIIYNKFTSLDLVDNLIFAIVIQYRSLGGLTQACGAVSLGQAHQERFERLDQSTQLRLVVSPGIDGT